MPPRYSGVALSDAQPPLPLPGQAFFSRRAGAIYFLEPNLGSDATEVRLLLSRRSSYALSARLPCACFALRMWSTGSAVTVSFPHADDSNGDIQLGFGCHAACGRGQEGPAHVGTGFQATMDRSLGATSVRVLQARGAARVLCSVCVATRCRVGEAAFGLLSPLRGYPEGSLFSRHFIA
jgi:hypothetical protein